MKKIALIFIITLTSFLIVYAQKENGIVYIEHEAINKTKAMWAAFVKGDKDAFVSFFADSIWVGQNGNYERKPQKYMGGFVDWWKNFDRFEIKDDKPAFPDAIEYKAGGLWVQDWQLWTGIHRATGINIKIRVHNLYRFNKDGKIDIANEYFDNDIFDEIDKSQKTIESGVVYKYHPFINNTRKLVNAYCAKDKNLWISFYVPDANFSNLSLKAGESFDLKTRIANAEKNFTKFSTIDMVQSGQPVCVAYEKEYFVVYSWWILSVTDQNGIKKSAIPVMMSHGYNDNGKVTWEAVSVDSKQLE